MICLTPITLFRKKRKIGAKYASDVVPCGKCPPCLQRRQAGWVFRLQKEQQISTSSAFLTLTYQDQNLPRSKKGLPDLRVRDHQLFIKRLRKTINENFPQDQKIKYYACGEYGSTTQRPHYHSIIFNLPNEYLRHPDLIQRDWKLGQTMVAEANGKTIRYVTKYITKTLYTEGQDDNDDRRKEFSCMSKGLGSSYLTPAIKEYYRTNKTPYLIVENGEKRTMPRYYRDKIYSEADKIEIQKKTEEYLQKNPTFTSEKHRHDYTKRAFQKRKHENQLKRQQL